MATVNTSVQKVTITDVTSILVTDIIEDNGRFVRAVRFFGAADNGAADGELVHEIKVISGTKSAVEIPVPASGF